MDFSKSFTIALVKGFERILESKGFKLRPKKAPVSNGSILSGLERGEYLCPKRRWLEWHRKFIELAGYSYAYIGLGARVSLQRFIDQVIVENGWAYAHIQKPFKWVKTVAFKKKGQQYVKAAYGVERRRGVQTNKARVQGRVLAKMESLDLVHKNQAGDEWTLYDYAYTEEIDRLYEYESPGREVEDRLLPATTHRRVNRLLDLDLALKDILSRDALKIVVTEKYQGISQARAADIWKMDNATFERATREIRRKKGLIKQRLSDGGVRWETWEPPTTFVRVSPSQLREERLEIMEEKMAPMKVTRYPKPSEEKTYKAYLSRVPPEVKQYSKDWNNPEVIEIIKRKRKPGGVIMSQIEHSEHITEVQTRETNEETKEVQSTVITGKTAKFKEEKQDEEYRKILAQGIRNKKIKEGKK